MVSIKRASQITGISLYTLRYYEKEGIIENVQRDSNGNRLYSSKDLNWICLVSCLRETGMPLKDIKQYLCYMKDGRKTVPKRYEMILKQKQHAILEMEKMKQRIAVLEDKLQYYTKLLQDDNCVEEWNFTFWQDEFIDPNRHR